MEKYHNAHPHQQISGGPDGILDDVEGRPEQGEFLCCQVLQAPGHLTDGELVHYLVGMENTGGRSWPTGLAQCHTPRADDVWSPGNCI